MQAARGYSPQKGIAARHFATAPSTAPQSTPAENKNRLEGDTPGKALSEIPGGPQQLRQKSPGTKPFLQKFLSAYRSAPWGSSASLAGNLPATQTRRNTPAA